MKTFLDLLKLIFACFIGYGFYCEPKFCGILVCIFILYLFGCSTTSGSSSGGGRNIQNKEQ